MFPFKDRGDDRHRKQFPLAGVPSRLPGVNFSDDDTAQDIFVHCFRNEYEPAEDHHRKHFNPLMEQLHEIRTLPTA